MLAIGVEGAKNLAVAIVIGFIVLALVSASVIKNVTTKIASILLMLALALGAWTQRSSLQDCAERVKENAAAGVGTATTCTFFGADVEVPGVSVP